MRILLSVPPGTHVRDFLASGVARRLVDEGASLVVVSPYGDDPDFRSRFGGPRMEFRAVPFNRDFPPAYRWLRRILSAGRIAVPRPLRGLWNAGAVHTLPTRDFRRIIGETKPDLVVVPTAHKAYDVAVLLAARSAGIPTAGVIASWDNLKYRLGGYPDHLMVWNDMMREEAVRDHGFRLDQVTVMGTTYTDFHLKPGFDRDRFLKSIGLDPARKLIVIGTAPATSVCDHRFLIREILDAIRSNRFIVPCQVVCRLHPIEPPDSYAEFRSAPEIRWDIATHSYADWKFGESDVLHLRDLLKSADVMVNVASTITLESCLHDRPVVNLAYHPDDPEDFRKKVLIDHHRSHYRHVLARNGVAMAGSREQLIDMINAYLGDPSIHHEGRKRIADDLFNVHDGRRADAVAAKLLELGRRDR